MNILKAREHTKDLTASIRSTANSWRIIAFVLLISNIALVCGFTVIASQKRVIPYIVQVDSHGYEIAVKPAEEVQPVDTRVVIARIGTFIERLRTVMSDEDAQKNYMKWIYSSVPENSPALMTTNVFYKDKNPFKQAAINITKNIDVKSVLPISQNVWRAEWEETEYQGGKAISISKWSGLFTIGVTPTKDMASVIRNPLGIYVTEYTITENYK